MPGNESGKAGLAPIFILADDDRDASAQLVRLMGSEWFVIPVYEPPLIAKYARQFATTAILLADPIEYPQGGSARLLQLLLDEVRKPVVILAEAWDPGRADRWKRMGAYNCIPHPTRVAHRVEELRSQMQELTLRPVIGIR